MDRCQTPWYALDPLLEYVPNNWIIWEPAAGENHIVNKLRLEKYQIIGTDLLTGENFFDWTPSFTWSCQVTNPPYSVKFDWLKRSYELGKPFALLLPVETVGAAKAQRLFNQYGIEVVLLDKRVNFKMPNKGYDSGGAQFPTAWFTWGLRIGRQLTFAKITRYTDGQRRLAF